MEKADVELGFAAPLTPDNDFAKVDLSIWDGGQLGGYPTWLTAREAADARSLRCGNCGTQLIFVAQLYAPLDVADVQHDNAYHRMLYIFSCKSGRCSNVPSLPGVDHGSIVALRGQVSKAAADPPDTLRGKTCGICGLLGDSRCSRCKIISYCSREHQAAHWTGSHREECGLAQEGAAYASARECARKAGLVLRPWAVETDDEDLYLPEPDESKTGLGLSEIDADEPSIEDLTQRELAETTGASHAARDPVLHHFMDRVGAGEGRGQVVRYCRWPAQSSVTPDKSENAELEGEEDEEEQEQPYSVAPLWFTSAHRPNPSDIPPCARCGGPRAFEFQLMPQALSFVGNDTWVAANGNASGDVQALDWGTVGVYTCTRSCPSPLRCDDNSGGASSRGACREFVWVQSAATRVEIAAAHDAAQQQLRYLHESEPGPEEEGIDEGEDEEDDHESALGSSGKEKER